MSFAYSGSIFCAVPPLETARCQASKKMNSISPETAMALSVSERMMKSPWGLGAFDREACQIFRGFRRIEGLAHDSEGLCGGRGRREPGLFHKARRVRLQEDVAGDSLIADLALKLAPPLHLRQHPNREAFPWEGIEGDAIRVLLHIAKTVGVGAGEDLLDDCDGRIEIICGCNCLRYLLTIFSLRGKCACLDNGAKQRR